MFSLTLGDDKTRVVLSITEENGQNLRVWTQAGRVGDDDEDEEATA